MGRHIKHLLHDFAEKKRETQLREREGKNITINWQLATLDSNPSIVFGIFMNSSFIVMSFFATMCE